MKALGIKVLAGSGTIVALGGAGYGVHVLTDTTDSIENYLKKGNLQVVSQDTTADAKWAKVFDTYELEKDELNLKITDTPITNGESIKGWCKNKLTKYVKSTSELLYKQVAKWCTEYKTIKEQLSGKTFIEDLVALNSKYNQLPEDMELKVRAVSLASTVNQNQNGEKIKKWCTENAKRSYSKEDKFFFKHISSQCVSG